MTLEQKELQAIELLRHGANLATELNPSGYWVGFSGGKDSQVLLDLVQRSGVPYTAHYNVTSIDPPDNVYFIRKHYPEVEFLQPKENFFKLIEKKDFRLQHIVGVVIGSKNALVLDTSSLRGYVQRKVKREHRTNKFKSVAAEKNTNTLADEQLTASCKPITVVSKVKIRLCFTLYSIGLSKIFGTI